MNLAGTKFAENCTRNALTEAVAPGIVSFYYGGVSNKVLNGGVQATVMMLLMMCTCVAFTAKYMLNVQEFNEAREPISQLSFLHRRFSVMPARCHVVLSSSAMPIALGRLLHVF
eukprot:s395_g26.t1